MTKPETRAQLEERLLREMSNEDASSNPFADLSDEVALTAAAYIVETAAFNLATHISIEHTVELIEISHRLSEVGKEVSSSDASASDGGQCQH